MNFLLFILADIFDPYVSAELAKYFVLYFFVVGPESPKPLSPVGDSLLNLLQVRAKKLNFLLQFLDLVQNFGD